jgi:hypothetical protein
VVGATQDASRVPSPTEDAAADGAEDVADVADDVAGVATDDDAWAEGGADRDTS